MWDLIQLMVCEAFFILLGVQLILIHKIKMED